ncbi:hypothetical protein HPP92_012870 [Vanilla planifolia]|uniref:Uncharacterized protein n=1 Tax=Vanilla planifolia TaxID=51239 RepID=A0A835V037_VANPL|nr:hypothetical protein HPP92_012870 [Vanilla planifolia]
MEEKDVKGFIKREEFEMLSASLLDRILEPCKKAVADAGLKVDRLQSVELIGSGSRIPAITKILSEFFRKEPRRTLNSSECVARGCALQCAMLSPVFKVREYEVQDSFPFSIGFSTDKGPNSTLSSNILFRKGQPFPSVKMLTIHRFNTFHLEVFYADQSELPTGVDQKISCFQIGPFPVPPGDKAKCKVKLRLNLHGIVYVESASLIEDEINFQTSRDTNHAVLDNMAPETVQGVTALSEDGTSEQPDHPDRTINNRPSRRHEIPISETVYGGMNKGDLLEAQEQEKRLAYQDKLMEQTKDRKNALEAYVYEVRNKLFERYKSFASVEEREGISHSLQQTEEWLYEDGDDETEKVYTSKLDELKKLVDPIENRCKDEETRAEATRELLNCMVEHRMAAKSLGAHEQVAVLNECNRAEQWLREKSLLQDGLPKNVDPVLWSHDINKRRDALDMACRNITRMPEGSILSGSEDNRGSDQSSKPDSNMEVD